jgi:excisionase family DNA binding protein
MTGEFETTLTTAEYARLKGVTLDTVYKKLRAGRLPAERIDGRWMIAATPADEESEPEKVSA